MQVEGNRLQLGPRLLELGYENDPASTPDLKSYVPGLGGHRPYVKLIREFLARHGLVEEDVRSGLIMQRRGRIASDPLFSVDLRQSVDLFTAYEVEKIVNESRRCRVDFGKSGRRGTAVQGMSYHEASVLNHGVTLTSLMMDAMGDKVASGGLARTRGDFGRKLWLTLFHPETVEQAFSGSEVTFQPERQLTIPVTGMEALVASIRSAAVRQEETSVFGPALSVKRGVGGAFSAFAEGGEHLEAEHLVLAQPRLSSIGEAKHVTMDKAMIYVAWCPVKFSQASGEPPRVVHDIDPVEPIYRASRTDGSSDVVCLEYGHALSPPHAPEVVARDVRRLMGAEVAGEVLHAGQFPVTVYSNETVSGLIASRAEIKRLLGTERVHMTGNLSAPGSDSFNEQVVQGLLAAQSIIGAL